MPVPEYLCSFALKQVGLEGFDTISRLLVDQFSDQGKLLLRALAKSNRTAWKALELALAGESLWSRLADRADEKAFRQQIRVFLDRMPLPELTSQQQYRKQCLQDLKDALAKGVLLGELVPAALLEAAGPLTGYADPQQLLRVEKQALNRLAVAVQSAGFAALGWLLGQPASAGESIIVFAVRYFFRREVEKNPQLARGLQLTAVEDLGESQREAFRNLDQLVTQSHDALDHALLEARQHILAAVADVKAAVETQGQRLEGVENTLTGMQARMDQLLDRLGMLHQPVRPGHSLSLHNERERQLVKEMLAHYRQLPDDVRDARPDLMAKLGKLQLASGDFRGAEKSFQQAARLARGDDRAEAHHNAFRAALEQKLFDDALRELLEASRLDPERFAPFPMDRYEPLSILGAGGFGVTFLCRHSHSHGRVAVKSLTVEDLDRDGATVVMEAGILEQIRHPAIIGIRDCGYADKQMRRPYLVMEYFEGPTLEEHVGRNGPLPLDEVLPLARTLAEALQAAHAKRLLHRDVKPANVLLRRDHGGWEVRLIDFGLALNHELLAKAGSTAKSGKTITGSAIAGTIDYAAPEQFGKFAGRVAAPADVFGYGRTLTYALFGTPLATWHQYKALPDGVADFLSRCVQQNPDERPQSFAEVLALLDGLRPAPAMAIPVPVAAVAVPLMELPPPPRREDDRPARREGLKHRPEEREPPRRPRDRATGPLPRRPRETPTGTRMMHAALAIFLGFMGIHKFAQGNTSAGVIRLLICLTCAGVYVNMFIGWIEGIVYFTVSNEDYERIYHVEKKGWF